MDSISEQIKWFIVHHILGEDDTEEVGYAMNLKEAGILSSLWIVRLAAFIEERFSVTFDVVDFDENNFSSIASIERLVQAKMSRAS
jgi:acyl carrier protein